MLDESCFTLQIQKKKNLNIVCTTSRIVVSNNSNNN